MAEVLKRENGSDMDDWIAYSVITTAVTELVFTI